MSYNIYIYIYYITYIVVKSTKTTNIVSFKDLKIKTNFLKQFLFSATRDDNLFYYFILFRF